MLTLKITESEPNREKNYQELSQKEDNDEDEGFIATGIDLPSEKGKSPRDKKSKFVLFTTKDIILLSILGIFGGVISGMVPFSLLVKPWFPLTGGTQLVSGHHLIWMVIGYGLTKKKYSILYVAVIQGFVNFLVGASWGLFEVFINVYEGSSLIIGFLIMEHLFKEKGTRLGYAIAGGLGNITQVPFFWIITKKLEIYPVTLFIMAMMFAFISGAVIAGFLGKIIVDKIEKAGIL